MADLFSDLGLNVVGRKAQPLHAHIVAPLSEEDLGDLTQAGTMAAPRIKQLRKRHHALAKALVDGIPDGEAGIITGYSASRVSILKADPTFKELLAFYQKERENSYVELHDKIAHLGEDVIDEITARLEETPDEISIGQLVELGKLALDRSGFGPQSNQNVNVNVGLSEKLAEARARALAHRTSELVEARAIDITPIKDEL